MPDEEHLKEAAAARGGWIRGLGEPLPVPASHNRYLSIYFGMSCVSFVKHECLCARLLCGAGVEALSEGDVWQLVRGAIDEATTSRVRFEHVAAFTVLKEPFRQEGGFLKLCRAVLECGDGQWLASSAMRQCPKPSVIWAPVLTSTFGNPLPPRLCSVDAGTLTRTMKPRRPAIMERYAAEVAELEKHLR